MCCIEAILHLVRPDVMFTLNVIKLSDWDVSYANKAERGTPRIQRRMCSFHSRCLWEILNVCSKRWSNPPFPKSWSLFPQPCSPAKPKHDSLTSVGIGFFCGRDQFTEPKAFQPANGLWVGRWRLIVHSLRPLHPSAHQTCEHGHHHLGLHLH